MATASIINLFRDPPNLAVALDHMRAGIPVFPCHAVDSDGYKAKSPRVAGGHRAASLDEAEIRAWWEQWPGRLAGLGLAAAGLMAIDADRHGGPDGVAAWDDLAAQHGFDPEVFPTVDTPGEGRHVYMRRPAGMDPTNGEGSLPKGINVRGAGYTIAPGCVLPDGRRYAHDDATPSLALDIPDAPAWLVGVIGTGRQRAENNQAPACELDTPAAADRAVAYLAGEARPAIEGQGGDDTAYRTACHVKDLGISEAECLSLMVEHYAPRCVSLCGPEDEAEWLAAKVASAYANGQNRPGIASPAVDLAGIVIEPPRYIEPPKADVSWADDPRADKPIEWLLKEILPRNGVGIIYGAAKSGKSFLAFDLAARLGCGMPWFNIRTPKEPIGVLLLLGEGRGTVRTRLNAFRRATSAGHPVLAWAAASDLKSEAGREQARKIVADTQAGMAARGVRLALVVLDTLSSTLGLEDENASTETTKVLKALAEMASQFDFALLGLHHAGKNGQDRGTTAFRDQCDVMLAVEKPDEGPRKLIVKLNRNGREDWETNFDLDVVTLGIDADGDAITSCAVRPAGESPMVRDQRELLMMQFEIGSISVHGHRLPPGDRWGMTRDMLKARCTATWGEMSKDTFRNAFNRHLRELKASKRLVEVRDADGIYLVAVPQMREADIVPADLF